MDVSKSLTIARRRFQNGNYMLSLNKYGAARKEFEVALTLFERAGSFKEMAEALNNIGIILVKEGLPVDAKAYFERSYGLKKANGVDGEPLFNTLYNLVGLGGALSEEEFERYFLEMKAIGDSLGGEFVDIVAREKAVYDRFVEARERERLRREEEALARGSPSGALAHLKKHGLPALVRVKFILYGVAVDVPEFSYEDEGASVKLLGISHADGSASMGEAEFDAPYDSVEEMLSGAEEPALLKDAFRHVKRFMEAVAMVREDIGFCVGLQGFEVVSAAIRNAFGDSFEIYTGGKRGPAVNVTLTGEDAMLVNMMLSTRHSLYKMLLLNAKRSMSEGNYSLCVVDAVAGFEAFLDLLLKKALPEAERKDYLSLEDPCLYERLRFFKKLIGRAGDQDSLEHCLGDAGRELDDALACYGDIMSNGNKTIGACEAAKALEAVKSAIYNLKSRYEV